MKVYRIEDHEGIGMYWSDFGEELDLPTSSDSHPGPCDDSLLAPQLASLLEKDKRNYFFGFVSISQLRNWLYMDRNLVDLHNAGFVLSVYDIPEQDVLVGHTQCMFLRSSDAWDKKISCNIKHYFQLSM